MHKDISIWMPLYIGDLQAKFARMTAEQIGAALLLMMDFWKNGAIPHDLATVCSITKLPQHTKAKTLLNTLMALELFEVESEQIHSNFLSSLKSQIKARSTDFTYRKFFCDLDGSRVTPRYGTCRRCDLW